MVFIISFPFFINSCNFFFYWNWKGYVLFSIFSSTNKMLITVRYVLKNYRTFLQYAPLWITYAICSTSIFSCVVTMFANFILKIYLEFCLFKYNKFLHFHMISAVRFLISSFFFSNISYSLYLCFFYAFELHYCRYWKTWCNMFTYFSCRFIFMIIFLSINLFY